MYATGIRNGEARGLIVENVGFPRKRFSYMAKDCVTV